MFGLKDAIQLTVNTSNSRPVYTAMETSLPAWEFDGAVNSINGYLLHLRTRNTAAADELSLFLDKALALAG